MRWLNVAPLFLVFLLTFSLGASVLTMHWSGNGTFRPSNVAPALVDDRQITIQSPADVTSKRQALIQFIWGSDGFPSNKLPASVDLNVPSPVMNLNNLERVDTLHITLDPGDVGLAHHFIPVQKNNRLVILHHGHACDFNDNGSFGLQPTINALLSDGFSVLAVYMPHEKPGDCGVISHDGMFSTISLPPGRGSVMKFFLESTAVSLNYLKTKSSTDNFPVYRDFNMVGLSGGGWTTTVYAAIDPRIRLSFPVAGSLPLYLRLCCSVGDTEQFLDSFYQIAGYPDLYVLGSFGAFREQVQILNRYDNCCFGQNQFTVGQNPGTDMLTYDQVLRNYESQVQTVLTSVGSCGPFSGSFRLEIDDVAPRHMISQHAVNIILSELDRPIALNIDIKPGGSLNSINAESRGKIPVAILSAPCFDAPSRLDKTSLTFGRTGDEVSLAFCNKNGEDVNGDGLLDQVCHFNTQLAGFQAGDVLGVLKGKTVQGISVIGEDSVRIVR